MNQIIPRSARFDIRVPNHVREAVEMAAALQGRNLTDFLISAMIEKAEAVIDTHRRLDLTLRDQAMLTNAVCCEEAVEPNAFVQRMVEEYRDKVRSL